MRVMASSRHLLQESLGPDFCPSCTPADCSVAIASAAQAQSTGGFKRGVDSVSLCGPIVAASSLDIMLADRSDLIPGFRRRRSH